MGEGHWRNLVSVTSHLDCMLEALENIRKSCGFANNYKKIITAHKWFSEIGYLVSGSHFHPTASLPAMDYFYHFKSEEPKTSGKLKNFLWAPRTSKVQCQEFSTSKRQVHWWEYCLHFFGECSSFFAMCPWSVPGTGLVLACFRFKTLRLTTVS